MTDRSKGGHRQRGWLARLRADTRGNTLAIMAAAMMPLLGFAGCAIDAARLYATKSRLQQACDAGVLAGRRSMVDASTTNMVLDSTAREQANAFFTNNFQSGWYLSKSVSFTPSKTADAQVAGVASATVPMTILAIFGVSSKVISVQCEARYDIADTDILFVLDTTGSMACLPSDSTTTCTNYVNSTAGTAVSYTRPTDAAGGNLSMAGYPGTTAYAVPEKTGSRMAALRSAVLNFYDTMVANVDTGTHVRYGFVTYTSTVNAGRAIVDRSPAFMVGGAGNSTNLVNYQTRVPNGESESNSVSTKNNVTSSTCNGYIEAKSYSNGIGKQVTVSYSSSNQRCTVTTTTYTPIWRYKQAGLNVASYVAGLSTPDPTKATTVNTRWLGCIEERETTAGALTFETGNLPGDLDSSLIPTSDATRWRPMWPEVIYARNNYGSTSTVDTTGDSSSHPAVAIESKLKGGWISCGKPVQRLREMTRAEVSTYVNATDFRAIGGTYHDTGMIWGTRMIDPTGIFANDTAPWPHRAAPNRVIVFLTDGDMAPSENIYGMYGIENYDKRVSNGNFTDLKTYHNNRFLAACSKAKSLKIDVWTVTIGSGATSQLQSCATSNTQALYTSDGTGLVTTFATIAKRVAMLRLSR